MGERTIRVERAAAGAVVKATKTGPIRTVRLMAPLAEDLERWREVDYRNWRVRLYKPLAAAVGLVGSTPYDLRHSFASLLIHEGVSVVEVARQMGNAPDVTLGTYAHVFEELDPADRVSAVEAIRAARGEFDVREMYAETESGRGWAPRISA